jgi:hypothetical protein
MNVLISNRQIYNDRGDLPSCLSGFISSCKFVGRHGKDPATRYKAGSTKSGS